MKDNNLKKDNYQPLSILINLSEVFKIFLYNQIAHFFDKLLSKHHCDLLQGHSAHYSLRVLFEK